MPSEMKALFLWDSDYPWDIRVEKICITLRDAGWEMHLVCRNRARRLREEFFDGIHIHRIRPLELRWGSLNDLYGFPFFLSPVWLARIWGVARRQRVRVIVVRDLPMAPAALIIGKALRIPVILDMAECYPELVRLIWHYEPFRATNLLVRNPFFTDLVETVVLRNIDRVWVMVEESGQRLRARGILPGKVALVSNTPQLERFRQGAATFPGGLERQRGKTILLYVGFLTHSRGLASIIKAMPTLLKENADLFLALVGKGTAERTLHELAHHLGVEQHVGFEGWVDNSLVPAYVASADICLVPHHRCGHWDHTIPNKLFDYMAAGKPVLASDARPMARIVKETGCGLVYMDGDQEHLALQALRLFDPDLRRYLGAKGMQAVERQYNWQQDAGRMLASLEGIISHA